MDVISADLDLSSVAAAIGDPARARMLCCLLDGHARTATELAAVGEVTASTASGHFQRLRDQGLVRVDTQGKHRYYRLSNREVGQALEALLVIAGTPSTPFEPSTPQHLRFARSCYRHMAGEVAVRVHDACLAKGWLHLDDAEYRLSEAGEHAMRALGLDLTSLRNKRRALAKPCMDWSARRPHMGGTLAEGLLDRFLASGWVVRELDSRALNVTALGKRKLMQVFGIAF